MKSYIRHLFSFFLFFSVFSLIFSECLNYLLLFRFSGWVVLGKPRPDTVKAYTEAGFQGHLSKVQVWGRALDVTNEIQKQVNRNQTLVCPKINTNF